MLFPWQILQDAVWRQRDSCQGYLETQEQGLSAHNILYWDEQATAAAHTEELQEAF